MQFLLENFRKGGAKKVLVVIWDGKWYIPAYFNHGSPLQLSLAYLLMGVPFGPPKTIKEDTVMLGFTDILVSPDDSFLYMRSNFRSDHNNNIFSNHETNEQYELFTPITTCINRCTSL